MQTVEDAKAEDRVEDSPDQARFYDAEPSSSERFIISSAR